LIGNDFCGDVYSDVLTVNFGTFQPGGTTVISQGNYWWRDDIWTSANIVQADVKSEGDIGRTAMGLAPKIPNIYGTYAGSLVLANGANNDVTPTTPVSSEYYKIIGPSAAFSVSGFRGGVSGRRIRIFNSTAQQMTIKNLAGSAAANQIQTLTGA